MAVLGEASGVSPRRRRTASHQRVSRVFAAARRSSIPFPFPAAAGKGRLPGCRTIPCAAARTQSSLGVPCEPDGVSPVLGEARSLIPAPSKRQRCTRLHYRHRDPSPRERGLRVRVARAPNTRAAPPAKHGPPRCPFVGLVVGGSQSDHDGPSPCSFPAGRGDGRAHFAGISEVPLTQRVSPLRGAARGLTRAQDPLPPLRWGKGVIHPPAPPSASYFKLLTSLDS